MLRFLRGWWFMFRWWSFREKGDKRNTNDSSLSGFAKLTGRFSPHLTSPIFYIAYTVAT